MAETAAQISKRQEEEGLRAQPGAVVTQDGKIVVPRTPAEEAEFRHLQEERRLAKQQEFDPKIHGVGTVTPVEPQSVRDMFQYYLALEARVKELEVGAEEAAASRQASKYPPNPNPTARDNPLNPVRLPTNQPINQPAAVAEVEESGGTQTSKPSPFSPHK